RDGQQEAGAVTGSVVGCHRTPMPDTVETVERSLDDLAAWTAVGVGHKPDAAGIMLESRIVQARVFAVQIPPRACFRGKRKQDAMTCVLSENLLYRRARRTSRLRIIAPKTMAPNSCGTYEEQYRPREPDPKFGASAGRPSPYRICYRACSWLPSRTPTPREDWPAGSLAPSLSFSWWDSSTGSSGAWGRGPFRTGWPLPAGGS